MEQKAQFGINSTDVNGSIFVQKVTSPTRPDMTTFNLTGPSMTSSSSSSVPVGGPSPTSVKVLVTLMAFVTIVGFISNTVTFITLIKNPKGFSPVILLLLRVQSFLDAIACLFGALVTIPTPMWKTHILWLDYVVCYVWHSQAIYWSWVLMTIWNLIYIAVDRYRCVCQPLRYYQSAMTGWYLALAALPVASTVLTLGAYFQTRMINGTCYSMYRYDGHLMEKLMISFSISTYLSYYLIPTICFIALYSRVIYAMRKRQGDDNIAAATKTMNKAKKEITKTAIVVTIIFSIALGYDLTYYLLGYLGVVPYTFGSVEQRIGVLFACVNNFANPIVYVAMMEKYRENVKKTWCPCLIRKKQKTKSQMPSSLGNSTTTVNSRI